MPTCTPVYFSIAITTLNEVRTFFYVVIFSKGIFPTKWHSQVHGDLISSMIQSILNGFLLMLEFFKEIWNMRWWVL